MKITLNIKESGEVELTKEFDCLSRQGECCVTEFNFVYPAKIKGYAVSEFSKHIEFGECKQFGECVKFMDEIKGDTYELNEVCTSFDKIMVQLVFERIADNKKITWKTTPFVLEFTKSVNAEGQAIIQTQLLSLAAIEQEWENYIKNNTFRVVSKVGDMPTANATNLGRTIFYLGANSTSPYKLTYGHYYKCNYVNKAYQWTDLTQDPSLTGVANAIREINNNQSMQLWIGTKEELQNEVLKNNVVYIPEDHDMGATLEELLNEIAEKNGGILKVGDAILPRKKLLWEGEILGSSTNNEISLGKDILNKTIEIEYHISDMELNGVSYLNNKNYFKTTFRENTNIFFTCPDISWINIWAGKVNIYSFKVGLKDDNSTLRIYGGNCIGANVGTTATEAEAAKWSCQQPCNIYVTKIWEVAE